MRILKLVFILPLLVACSSTNRYDYYKITSPLKEAPPSVHQELQTVSFNYKKLPGKNEHQSAWIKINNYSRKTYTVGPLLLPLIPVFGSWRGQDLDPNQLIELELTAYSAPVFSEKLVQLPMLEIETPRGTFKPKSIVEQTPFFSKKFIYDLCVADTPWFIIRESKIELEKGQTLKIPETRLERTNEFIVHWYEPIAP